MPGGRRRRRRPGRRPGARVHARLGLRIGGIQYGQRAVQQIRCVAIARRRLGCGFPEEPSLRTPQLRQRDRHQGMRVPEDLLAKRDRLVEILLPLLAAAVACE